MGLIRRNLEGLRTRLAGYGCPNCGAAQDYRWIAPLVQEVVRTKERARVLCTSCRDEFNLYPASAEAEAVARRIWGLGAVTAILASLAALGGLQALAPGLPVWPVALAAVGACCAGLPLIEARAMRGRAIGRAIARRSARPAA